MKRKKLIQRLNSMCIDAEKACDRPGISGDDWRYSQGQRDAFRTVLALVDPPVIMTPAEERAVLDLCKDKFGIATADGS